MEKYLHVEYQWSDEDDPRTILLEGNHRQTNDRIIQQFLRRKLGDGYESTEDDDRFRKEDRVLTVVEVNSVSQSEAKSLKSSTFTLVVNEHVTDPACRVSYSGPVPG